MKNKKNLIIGIVKFAVAFLVMLFLMIPQINPLLNGESKQALIKELKKCFGIFKDEGTVAVFAIEKIIAAVVVALFVYILTTVICFVIRKTMAGQSRSKTVAEMIISIIKAVGAISAVVWVLSVMGVNITAIFASLGIASLIIGFGVQSLIEDCVTGIFIIIGGEYNIGDIIVFEDFRGTVEKITMRTTTIRDDGGNLKIINNSDIRNIQNRSNNQSIAVSDISISYSEDLLRVEKILEEALPQMYEKNKDVFAEAPIYCGVQALADSAVVLRVRVTVAENKIFPATRCLNRELKLLFDEKGIEIPFNQIVVHKGN